MLSKRFYLMLAIIIAIVLGIYWVKTSRTGIVKNIAIDGVVLPTPQDIKDFHLTDNHGKSFTKTDLKGHWTLLFFGFTNCGMVCPTTMDALNKTYQVLKTEVSSDSLPQVVFVSVDPDRDTISRMNSYVNSFNPSFIGARGSIQETVALEKQLHIAAAKMQVDAKGKNHYTINHTADVLLFNPDGQLQAFLAYPHTQQQMVKDYKLIIKSVA